MGECLAHAYLKYFIIQNPRAKHDDTIDVYYGVVTAVEELYNLLFTVQDQGDIFPVDTDGNPVPPAKTQIFRQGKGITLQKANMWLHGHSRKCTRGHVLQNL